MRRRTFVHGAAAAASVSLTGYAEAQTARARVLRFVPQTNLTVLDPIFTSTSVTRGHGYLIYDTLFGVAGDDSFLPRMAEGYSSDDGGRTYLIRLRDGLKFHNGEPVRAQDCVASLKRWTARDVVGQTVAQFVDEWDTKDDRTIRVTLKQPLPVFMELIGRGGASVPFIMPEHVAASDPFKPVTETIGSGPFKFARSEFVAGSLMIATPSMCRARNHRMAPRAARSFISIVSSGGSSLIPRPPPRGDDGRRSVGLHGRLDR
jgi:peptide/nickel transport system substrate-binding protein